ncbi:recombinase family protein [Chryseobacterium jejuense]|uniref:recombinase family protein n=1 Tax=Chryseobacterium jejuense TaxID=445960 RepID=UPI001AE5B06B|nr:recombinase family protein [Chryseobacterium jejuense]MBP2618852.1 uroporphyrinogen-III decarboxylase [Chryseobacterium jejuense]
MQNFKNIHIGELIQIKLREEEISMERIVNFMKHTEPQVKEMFQQENLSTDILLKWCKLLEYDFFRVYSQHLILYSPPRSIGLNNDNKEKKKSVLPEFKKNVYTREIIDFIVELIIDHKKTQQKVVEEYRIPRTTLYKWLKKYPNNEQTQL